MSRRSRAREVALQILYQEDLNGERDPVQEEAFFCARIKSDSIRQFARDLVNGVRTKQLQIDACLVQFVIYYVWVALNCYLVTPHLKWLLMKRLS